MKSDSRHPIKSFALYSTIVSQLAGCPVIGMLFGKWLDQQLLTTPWCMVTGLLLGIATGTLAVIKTINKL